MSNIEISSLTENELDYETVRTLILQYSSLYI